MGRAIKRDGQTTGGIAVATNIPAHIWTATRKAEVSQMICEAQRWVHVRSLPKGVEGFVRVKGVHACG